MPLLSTREVEARKRERGTFRDHDWYSYGHAFTLEYSDGFNAWVITGGCREWRNVSEALSHYHKGWHSSDGITTEEKRLERRRIVNAIGRFAKKYKIRMAIS